MYLPMTTILYLKAYLEKYLVTIASLSLLLLVLCTTKIKLSCSAKLPKALKIQKACLSRLRLKGDLNLLTK
jgi:hypothetical protein